MKLLRLKVEGFGPLRGEWTFAPDRLNLVVDDNERGKSSLLAAITAALYGLQDDRRSHRVLTPRERWRPWQGGSFRVELELQVQSRRLRIDRDFERGTVGVFEADGREVTAEFLSGRDEYPVGQRLLGLDVSEFEKCALVRQGELDLVVPGDEKARRASTMRARLESAADTNIGDTNASEAIRVLEDALRRYDAPELGFTGTVDNAIDRLEAQQALVETDLHAIDQDLARAQEPLEELNRIAEEEQSLRETLRRIDADRQSGVAAEVRRKLDDDERQRGELRVLEAEAAGLEAAAHLPPSVEADLRETVARYEEAKRNLGTREERRREETAGERQGIEEQLQSLQPFADYTTEEADRCVAVAADLRRVSLEDTHQRQQVFVLRDQLAAKGYEPERIQFLNARFGPLSGDQQGMLRAQGETNLAFQTEVAALEQERTGATEMLREIDAQRIARRGPALLLAACGIGAAVAGGVLLALRVPLVVWAPLLALGALLAAVGGMLVAGAASARGGERDGALVQLADSQKRLNQLRTRRAQNEVALADMAGLMGYRDAVDLMRHWNEYARMLEDSSPLLRAQELLAHAETQRQDVLAAAAPLLRAMPGTPAGPELLEKLAYEARRAIAARGRLAQLDRSGELDQKGQRIDEAAVTGLHERAVRILHSAGLAHDPERPWSEHLAELASRTTQRDRWKLLVEELVPAARRRLLPDGEIEQCRRQLELLGPAAVQAAAGRPAAELEVEAGQARTRLDAVQHRRSDLRTQVEEVWRRHTRQSPELENQRDRMAAAARRARRFKEAVELARATIQEVAVDTHRRWADFLGARVAELLERFGTHVGSLRFGEDLDFSVQLDDGPQVSQGKAHLQLSAGARDQLYLAVRLAVSEFLSRGTEPLPLLLDDVFATSDDDRLRAGMRALIDGHGGGHQVLVVTCHRGRHHDLMHRDAELYRERVHWIDLQVPVRNEASR